MKFTILIPHWKTSKTTAYSVAQFLKFKGKHEVEIVVIDNSYPDKSIESLSPFLDEITILHNTSTDKISSHGTALDVATNLVSNEWLIAAESDSFPTRENWLDYYEDLIDKGYDCAGSMLKLSGGTYTHPAGMLFRKSVWAEAMKHCQTIPYHYFPNMSMKEGFPAHLMVHNDILYDFLAEPDDYIELSEGYKPYHPSIAERKRDHYLPICGVFHNGMGYREESIHTYGLRTVASEATTVIFEGKRKLINRLGAEPGQFFSWYHAGMYKKVFNIPTETKWMQGRINEQQEYTEMVNGFRHLWAGTSFLDMKGAAMNDVYEFKKNQIDELYNSLPEHQKIKQ